MKKNGLELLTVRDSDDQIDSSEFEKRSGILLPPVYRTFIKAFKMLGDGTIHNPFRFYFSEESRVRNFGEARHINDEVLLGAFYDLDKSFELMNDYYPTDDLIWKDELFLIGTNDMNHSIMVGVGTRNQDKIFIDRFDLEPRFIEVADNILSLIRGFNTWPDEEMLYGPKLSQLYKNWDEDFWRVREEV